MSALALRPDPSRAELVVPAPGAGAGNWAGAASALLADDVFYLAYRVRRPLGSGRGVTVVVARSTDGVAFTPVVEVGRQQLGAESLERPALVRTDEGLWRLYLSCATWDSKHWWIPLLEASSLEGLTSASPHLCLPGSSAVGVKDPVVERAADGWRMWVCCHPLTPVGHEDRMTTRWATSPDGRDWTMGPEVLAGTPGTWDARGARVTAVLGHQPLTVAYDGRAAAEENWYERTGIARAAGDTLVAVPDSVVGSPHSDGALRYLSAVPLPSGGSRLYYELARPDGAHDLVTELVE